MKPKKSPTIPLLLEEIVERVGENFTGKINAALWGTTVFFNNFEKPCLKFQGFEKAFPF